MKKVLMVAIVGAAISLSGCADHPYLSAGAAALAAGAVATMSAKHDNQNHHRATSEGWYDENGEFHRYAADGSRGHGHHHHKDQVRCSELPYDAPNWQREQCSDY